MLAALAPEELSALSAVLSEAAGSTGRPLSLTTAASIVLDVARRIEQAWPELAAELGVGGGVRGAAAAAGAGGGLAQMSGFMRHLAARLPEDAQPAAPLGDLVVEDLFLAHACTRSEAALRTFEREHGRELKAAFAKLRVPLDRRDDARQQIWEKLFLAAPRPRILDYSGRGRLRTWFRVTVVRALLDEMRSDKRSPEVSAEEALLGAASAAADPEVEHLKRLYQHEFSAAFEDAARALGPEERNVLRSYYGQSMTIDEIAVAFGIHRATAARRVASARETLLTDTRRRLSNKLALGSRELESVFRLIESRLHISVNRLLK